MVSPFFRSGGRTDVLSHIYNPPKPSFDKEGLWQDLVLHCFAIAIVAFRSCKNRLEISIWSPTIEDKSQDLSSFFISIFAGVALHNHHAAMADGIAYPTPPIHHATFGGTPANITLSTP